MNSRLSFSLPLACLFAANISFAAVTPCNPQSTATLPATSPAVFGVNAGGSACQGSDGIIYQSDGSFSGGTVHRNASAIGNTVEDRLYQSNRYGNFKYKAFLPNGKYRITLLFAEDYHSSAGKRRFDVLIEGIEAVSNLDIYAVAGKNSKYSVTRSATVSDGNLVIEFRTDIDNALVSGIHIFREDAPVTTACASGEIGGTLDVSTAQPGSGRGFTLAKDLGVVGDSSLYGEVSPVKLYENGKLLRNHATPAEIESTGDGRYSYRSNAVLHFSASDSSDPRSNGRKYSYCVPSFCTVPKVPAAALNVKNFGARGDGSTDDTAKIQAAISAAGTGSTVFVPAGTYRINPSVGVKLKSGMTFHMDPKAVLYALPTDRSSYGLLQAYNRTNIKIYGGTIRGDRDSHIGTDGEHGMCLKLMDSSGIDVVGVVTRDCWGDGVYVGGTVRSNDHDYCSMVTDRNRRNGMSVVIGSNIRIHSNMFVNTIGTKPENGLDLETNDGLVVENVVVSENLVRNNAKQGIQIVSLGTGINRNNQYLRNRVIGNGTHGIDVKDSAQLVQGNYIDGNKQSGIVTRQASNIRIVGNTIRKSGNYGILTGGTTQSVFEKNLFESNYPDYFRVVGSDLTIRLNECVGTGTSVSGIHLGLNDNVFDDNTNCDQ